MILSAGFSPLSLRAQDNSPYSRYGIGDLVPHSNIIGRAMGGISAGYSDVLSINFNNPATFGSFQAFLEQKSRKLVSGRAVLDLGVNFESRTLRESLPPKNFTATNALFSYVYVGMPVRRNWGIAFGMRPISRISYKVVRNERLLDPITGQPIDSVSTRFEGDGGAFLPSVGTGVTVFRRERKNGTEERLSLGLNLGYLFGKKDYSSRRGFVNDSVEYQLGNFQTRITFGDLYFSGGVQYKFPINAEKRISLTLGGFGNWKQDLNASRDQIRETFSIDPNLGELRLDSVSEQRDFKGSLVYPASYTLGIMMQKTPVPRESGWLFGIDFSKQAWNQYRLYGQRDSVRDRWQLHLGGQFNPAATRNYFSNVSYRAGFSTGPDYIQVGQKLPQFGASIGLGLPLPISRQSPNQASIIQFAFEYNKRGNNDNLLQENLYRVSLGFSLSDFWFQKRKYD